MKILKFIKLAKKRFEGREEGNYINYLKFQKFQAEEIINELKLRNIDLSMMNVLELGAGKGGYSSVFKKNSKNLTVSDIEKPFINHLKFKKVDVNKKFPFKNNSFDFVFCCSLIEHLKHPEKMISEIKRVLKPNGYLYLSFPPFYSPVGGHGLKPFHLLGEKTSIKIVNLLKKRNYKSYDKLWDNYGLHIRTISEVKKLLLGHDFKINNLWTRFSPINTTKIPFFNEFLTWHACFLCKK